MPADILNTQTFTRTFKTTNGTRIVIDLEINQCHWETRRSWIDQSPTPDYTEISLTGEIYEKFHRQPESVGQIQDTIKSTYLNEIDNPKNRSDLIEILAIWNNYHLASRCITQKQYHALQSANLEPCWTPDNAKWLKINHPELYNEGNIPFGNEWLIRVIPEPVIDHLKKFFKPIKKS
jgi:hypothetical protein